MKSSRRNFLQHSLLGTAGLGLGIASTSEVHAAPVPNAAEPEITQNFDVLVVGGGTAGTIAAIQAGRAGASVLLVERNSQLGGTMTTGGVAFPGLFDAWGKQVIAGIGWELVKESVELDGGTFPDFSKVPQRHYQNQVFTNQFLYAILAEEKCEKAGVEIAYYEFPQAVTKTNDGWQVDCVGFGTRRRVNCKQIIDCTGGAEVVGLLGLPRLREDERQPGSFLYMMGKAHDPGRNQIHRLYVHGADSTNSRTVTTANLTGRKSILATMRAKRAAPHALAAGNRLPRKLPHRGRNLDHRERLSLRQKIRRRHLLCLLSGRSPHQERRETRAAQARHRADRSAARADPQGQPQHHGRRTLREQRPLGKLRTARAGILHGHGPGGRCRGRPCREGGNHSAWKCRSRKSTTCSAPTAPSFPAMSNRIETAARHAPPPCRLTAHRADFPGARGDRRASPSSSRFPSASSACTR